jgi:hypothetical protein
MPARRSINRFESKVRETQGVVPRICSLFVKASGYRFLCLLRSGRPLCLRLRLRQRVRFAARLCVLPLCDVVRCR